MIRSYSSYIRFSNWWQFKAAPIVGLFYLLVYANKIDFVSSLLVLGASVATIIGIAGLGYFLNDIGDIEFDKQVNKVNRAASMSVARRCAMILLLLIIALAPWIYLPNDIISWSLIAFQFVLYVVYSFQPFRFKEKGLAGVICDSLYGLTVPALLAVYTYHLIGTNGIAYFPLFIVLLFLLLVTKGFRNILLHQLDDRRNDKRSGIKTLVLDIGGGESVWLINALISPLEFFLLTAWIAVVSFSIPFFWISVVVFGFYHLLKIGGWGMFGIPRHQLKFKFLYALNDYYELWFPICTVLLLIGLDWRFSFFIVLTILLFPNIIISSYQDFKKINENIKKYRTGDYGKWWSKDGRLKVKRSYAEDIFVFAACGKEERLTALHFSLNMLKHFSQKKIIIITDSSRNKITIDGSTTIDVKTPVALNDHQASLFLKTSVHQHLPKGNRYCFLDPFVIAMSTEVDNIFEQKLSDVMFAPDTHKLSSLSPLALHCGCLSENSSDKDLLASDNSLSLGRQRELLRRLEDIKRDKYRYFRFLARSILSPDIFKLDDDTFFHKKKKYWFNRSNNIIYYEREIKQCNHLIKETKAKFLIEMHDPDWLTWNSNLFLFNDWGHEFMESWHDKTMATFHDPHWRDDDRGALAATIWEQGIQHQAMLIKKFNFIADSYNSHLRIAKDGEHLSDDNGTTNCKPAFIQVSHHFGIKGWDIWDWIDAKASSITLKS